MRRGRKASGSSLFILDLLLLGKKMAGLPKQKTAEVCPVFNELIAFHLIWGLDYGKKHQKDY